jgi:hypothetical protein
MVGRGARGQRGSDGSPYIVQHHRTVSNIIAHHPRFFEQYPTSSHIIAQVPRLFAHHRTVSHIIGHDRDIMRTSSPLSAILGRFWQGKRIENCHIIATSSDTIQHYRTSSDTFETPSTHPHISPHDLT